MINFKNILYNQSEKKKNIIVANNDVTLLYGVDHLSTVEQVLENACERLNMPKDEYELRYGHTKLDSRMRLWDSAIPENAEILLIKSISFDSGMVSVSLITEEETVRIGKFKPTDTLWDIVMELCQVEVMNSGDKMSLIFFGKEISGKHLLSQTKISSLNQQDGKLVLRFKKNNSYGSEENYGTSNKCKSKVKLSEDRLKKIRVKRSKNLANRDFVIKPQLERERKKRTIKIIKRGPLHYQILEEFKEPVNIHFMDDRHAIIYHAQFNSENLQTSFVELAKFHGNKEACMSYPNQIQDVYGKNDICVRVLFPDKMILQGKFKSVETIGDVMKFINKYLENPKLTFYLCKDDKKTILGQDLILEKTLLSEKEILHYGNNQKFLKHREQLFLKQNLKDFALSELMAMTAAKIRRGCALQKLEVLSANSR